MLYDKPKELLGGKTLLSNHILRQYSIKECQENRLFCTITQNGTDLDSVLKFRIVRVQKVMVMLVTLAAQPTNTSDAIVLEIESAESFVP